MECLEIKNLYGKNISVDEIYIDREEGDEFHVKTYQIEHPAIRGTDRFIELDQIKISYKKFTIQKPVQIKVEHHGPLLKCQFELKGTSSYLPADRKAEHKIHINQQHCQLFGLPQVDGWIQYNSSHEALDLMIDMDLLVQIMEEEDLAIPQFLESIKNKECTKLFEKPIAIDVKSEQLIQEIINLPFKGNISRIYLQSRAIELLIIAIKKAMMISNSLICSSRFCQKDKQILMAIKEHIEKNPAAHYELLTLARNFGINDFKLKKGFKELFGYTVFQYILCQRMERAQYLILNTDLEIKEISGILGYKYPQYFSKLFLKYYQLLPNQMRMNSIKLKD